MTDQPAQTEDQNDVVRALVALARPLPKRALVLDDVDGDLTIALAKEGVDIVSVVPEDSSAVDAHDRAAALGLADRIELRVGDPLGSWGLELQGSLFAFRDAQSRREARLLRGAPWPLVIADVRSAGLSSDERRRLRPWFESARGQFPREVVLIERASRLTTPTGRLVFACRPDLFGREFGVLLSEKILAPLGPHVIVDGRNADPARVIVGREPDAEVDRAVRPRLGVPRGGRWSVIVDGLSDPTHPWVEWRDVPAGLSDPADALDSRQARELLEAMEEGASSTAESLLASMPGRTTACGFRDVWRTEEDAESRLLLAADGVRDWQVVGTESVFWPYDRPGRPSSRLGPKTSYRLVQHRPLLEARRIFGDSLQRRGLKWYEHVEHYPARIEAPFRIACSTRGTHNHAVRLHDSEILTSSSNIVLPANDEDASFLLLALLNSSLVCFWAKHARTGGRRFELSASHLLELPIPSLHHELLVSIAKKMDRLARQFTDVDALLFGDDPNRIAERIASEREHRRRLEGELVWWQEELDWAVYAAYGLVRRTDSDTLPRPIDPEARAFLSASQHPARAALIEHDPRIRAIERPNYKRPFGSRDFEDECASTAVAALIERLQVRLEPGVFVPEDELRSWILADPVHLFLLEMAAIDPEDAFETLVWSNSVSVEPARLYSRSGWKKFLEHSSRCLAAARRESGDHGESIEPIVWDRGDFSSRAGWRRRGRNDVSGERFWSFDSMKTFEGHRWVGLAPRTAPELVAIRAELHRLLDEFGFHSPAEDDDGGAAASLRLVFSVLSRLEDLMVVSDRDLAVTGSSAWTAGAGAEDFSEARRWLDAGAPAPSDPPAIQLDLDRIAGIRTLLAERSGIRLREARSVLVARGWKAREVRLALDALVEQGELRSNDDPFDPHFTIVER